ncbi:hypothetical protein HAX54_019230 [Datura stramonium]|uniref:Uncharacterized protein n=1 Tax=Datura stramonium TaxID=4076 RepID=A0ABS8UNU3_DATST|nr:hypothetical protein [Datura stramonium]
MIPRPTKSISTELNLRIRPGSMESRLVEVPCSLGVKARIRRDYEFLIAAGSTELNSAIEGGSFLGELPTASNRIAFFDLQLVVLAAQGTTLVAKSLTGYAIS